MDPLELRVLLEHAISFTRVKLITHSDHEFTEEQARAVSGVLLQDGWRVNLSPILLGFREFYGLPFTVTPDMMISETRKRNCWLIWHWSVCLIAGRFADLGTEFGCDCRFRWAAIRSRCRNMGDKMFLKKRFTALPVGVTRFPIWEGNGPVPFFAGELV